MPGITNTFQVRDKVRVTNQANRHGQMCPPLQYVGQVGTITANDLDAIWVRFEDGRSYACFAGQLAVVKPHNATT
jgi:hypothetical protein